MSFSFVIIDKTNSVDITKTNEYLKENYTDYEVLYCSPKSTLNQPNVRYFTITPNDDTESIINSVISKATKNKIVVVREFDGVEKIKSITDALKSPDAIVYYQKPLSGVKRFFTKLLKKLSKLIYGREITLASHAIVGYGENTSRVLKLLEYPSNAMRKFSWVGVNAISLGEGKNCRLPYKKVGLITKTLLPLVMSVVLLVLYALFRTKIPMLWEIIMLLTILIGATLFVIYGTNWFIKSQIGENLNSKSDLKEE